MVKGIDGLYENTNPNSNVKYVEDEAKFGGGRLGMTKDGKQMSDDWLKGSNRIFKAVDGDKELAIKIRIAMRKNEDEKVLSKIDDEGNVNKFKIDVNGNVYG